MFWQRGIDIALSVPGAQVGLAGYSFVDPINGNDANPGTPESPVKTVSAAPTTKRVLAPGVYPVAGTGKDIYGNIKERVMLNLGGAQIEGEKHYLTIYNGGNPMWSGSANSKSINVIFIDAPYNYVSSDNNGYDWENCIFINSPIFTNQTSNKEVKNCLFVNSDFDAKHNNTQTNVFTRVLGCAFDKDSLLTLRKSNTNVDNALLHNTVVGGGLVENDQPFDKSGNVTIVDFEIITAAKRDKMQLFLDSAFSLDDMQDLYYRVLDKLKYGELVDLSSPAENNGITVGATVTGTGNIKPQWKVFSQPRISPIVKDNGLSSTLSHEIDVSYRSVVGGAITTKSFVVGLPMVLDNSGKSTGEVGFDPRDIASDWQIDTVGSWDNVTDINLIEVAEIQENFVLT